MDFNRIKEIQAETAYPNSTSVQQALLKVWNECEQEQTQSKIEPLKHRIIANVREAINEKSIKGQAFYLKVRSIIENTK